MALCCLYSVFSERYPLWKCAGEGESLEGPMPEPGGNALISALEEAKDLLRYLAF